MIRTVHRPLVLTLALSLAVGAAAAAQAPASAAPGPPAATREVQAAPDGQAPALTEEQKLRLQNLGQAMQIAQLQAQLAGAAFEKARTALAGLVTALQRPGYTLDLDTLTYVKAPSDAPAPPDPTKKDPKTDAPAGPVR